MRELLEVELVVVVGIERFHELLQFNLGDGAVNLDNQVVELVKVELAVAAELVLVKEGLDLGSNRRLTAKRKRGETRGRGES